MAGPTSAQSRLIAETEYHISALNELLTVYEFAMRKAITARRRDPQHIAWLAGRIEHTASMLLAAQERRTALGIELQAKTPA